MTRFTEIAMGKCRECGDQLLSVAPRGDDSGRRVVCPFCLCNNYEDLLAREGMLAGTRPPSAGTVLLTREEVERCSE